MKVYVVCYVGDPMLNVSVSCPIHVLTRGWNCVEIAKCNC